MDIALRGDDICIPHQAINLVNIGAARVQSGSKSVPQIVDAKLGPTNVIKRSIKGAFD